MMYRSSKVLSSYKGKPEAYVISIGDGTKKHGWELKYFWDWFNHCFILGVKHYLQVKTVFTVVLLLGDDLDHCCEELENADPNIGVLFMPPKHCVSLPIP